MAIDYIQGEKFQRLADNNKIFYVDTHNVSNFLKTPPKTEFVLISHNSDGNITKNPKRFNAGSSNDFFFDYNTLPKNLVKWFGQNVDVESEILDSIPIGLENSCWFPTIKKIDKINTIRVEEKKYINLLYINHNINTNLTERQKPYDILKSKNWCTTEYGKNGENFEQYLKMLHSHIFVLCPSGNGLDTHRFWETLYVNSIPVVKRNLNNKFYTDLPICFIDDWEELDENFLNEELIKIKKMEYNFEQLDFNFWKNKIKNTI